MRGGTRSHLGTALVLGVALCAMASAAAARPVSCLGRIEPHDGVYQLSGPSDVSVVAELRVDEGERVERGAVLATLDTHRVRAAELRRAEVALEHAQRMLTRERNLKATAATSAARLEEAERDVQVLEAEVVAARARLAMAEVRSPVDGKVLAIHARAGERIGPSGLLELGETARMYAVAEVYETDIGLVSIGQKATISSSALPRTITGAVERIGQIIGKSDVLELDPVARMDARVVEVFILLDDPEMVSGLTNLQVDVEIAE